MGKVEKKVSPGTKWNSEGTKRPAVAVATAVSNNGHKGTKNGVSMEYWNDMGSVKRNTNG